MITSHYDPKQRLMVHTADVELTVTDILSATAHWFGHPSFDAQAPVIWNLGKVRMGLSLEEMRVVYGSVRGAVSEKRTGGKTAWVHQSSLVRSVITLVHGEFDWGSEWQTFDQLADAQTWCIS